MSVVNIKKVNGKRPHYDVYIGRRLRYPGATFPLSKWANPFTVEDWGREECLKLYEEYIRCSKIYDDLSELKGKVLGCWCKPKLCHGDVLLKLLKELEDE